jgi:prepilin-type N-terminal cleavage/methylation domain-containing protein
MLRALISKLRKNEETGFTLIELMIVILVILILAAILLPQFGVARERARKASCVSNQRNIETAVAMWATDNPSTVYAGGTMNTGTVVPNMAALTGTVLYTTTAMFKEPDDPASTGTDGTDYYLSMGIASGTANQSAPSYGHIACAADKTADPWIASYDGTAGSVNGINHGRGSAATP